MVIKIYLNKTKNYFFGHNTIIPMNTYSAARVNTLGKSYWMNGSLHNEYGPAIIYTSGYKKYYLNGRSYEKEDWIKEFHGIKKIK